MKLSGTNITFSNVETHIIKSIDFGLMNPEEIVIIIILIFSLNYQYVKSIKPK